MRVKNQILLLFLISPSVNTTDSTPITPPTPLRFQFRIQLPHELINDTFQLDSCLHGPNTVIRQQLPNSGLNGRISCNIITFTSTISSNSGSRRNTIVCVSCNTT